MQELIQILEKLSWEKIGILGVAAGVIAGLIRGWIVPGIHFDRVVKERNEQTEIAKQALTTAATLTDHFRARE